MYSRANLAPEEDHLYKDFPHINDTFQITITFYLRLRIEHGSKHWKGLGK
jgi:hypothetical protein